MQRIESLLRSLPSDQRDAILFKNPSYVFFNKSAKRAITSLGVPATPGRTIATDAQFAPKGAVAFLQFSKPVFTEGTVKEDLDPHFVETSRFVVDQDTGGAITGTGRVDLFWGRGDEAKRSAGLIQHPARLVYLAPK
jgi:membrane-bound lytic murein transglycosylase A